MNELRKGWPSILPVTLTRPRVPKNLTDSGQTTYVQPPFAGLFCKVATNFLFSNCASDRAYRSDGLPDDLFRRRSGSGHRPGARWGDGIDGGAAVAGSVDGADAEDNVVFGDGNGDGGDVPGGDDAGPVGLVGVAIDDLESGAGGEASGLLPAEGGSGVIGGIEDGDLLRLAGS